MCAPSRLESAVPKFPANALNDVNHLQTTLAIWNEGVKRRIVRNFAGFASRCRMGGHRSSVMQGYVGERGAGTYATNHANTRTRSAKSGAKANVLAKCVVPLT